MKHFKNPTRRQKSIISKIGKMDPVGWYVYKETPKSLFIINAGGETREIQIDTRN